MGKWYIISNHFLSGNDPVPLTAARIHQSQVFLTRNDEGNLCLLNFQSPGSCFRHNWALALPGKDGDPILKQASKPTIHTLPKYFALSSSLRSLSPWLPCPSSLLCGPSRTCLFSVILHTLHPIGVHEGPAIDPLTNEEKRGGSLTELVELTWRAPQFTVLLLLLLL